VGVLQARAAAENALMLQPLNASAMLVAAFLRYRAVSPCVRPPFRHVLLRVVRCCRESCM